MWVSYLRVSTSQQGESGLGLEAQKDIVMRFIGNSPLLAEFTEVESGKRHKNRPQLQAALDLYKRKRAKLVIAKLDRLSRNVAFISSLMESAVDFVCCDNPHANRLMLHMLAAFAEHEREMISQRTKAALGRVKVQLQYGPRVSLTGRTYTKLGGPKLAEAREIAAAMKRMKPAVTTVDLMIERRAQGETFRAIATYVNLAGIRSAQGGIWHASTVQRALIRAGYTERLNEPLNVAIPSFCIPSTGRGTQKEGGMDMPHDIKEAERMLDLFTSVGAQSFVVTKPDIEQKLIWAKPYIAAELRQKLPAMVQTAATRRGHMLPDGKTVMSGENLIIRPTGDVTFVQLDDISADLLEKVRPAAFLFHATSPGNHQAWIAVSDVLKTEAKEFVRRVRRAVGDADKSASGATRFAGTLISNRNTCRSRRS